MASPHDIFVQSSEGTRRRDLISLDASTLRCAEDNPYHISRSRVWSRILMESPLMYPNIILARSHTMTMSLRLSLGRRVPAVWSSQSPVRHRIEVLSRFSRRYLHRTPAARVLRGDSVRLVWFRHRYRQSLQRYGPTMSSLESVLVEGIVWVHDRELEICELIGRNPDDTRMKWLPMSDRSSVSKSSCCGASHSSVVVPG